MLSNERTGNNLAVRDEAAENNVVAVVCDFVEPWNVAEVDQRVDAAARPTVHFQQKVCPAGDDPSRIATRFENAHSLFQGRGSEVL